ncbi:hypothetical protein OAO75_03120 [Candidatus Pelagibacter ubique]|nr:hypothetical protein [Candidatus Pelagibacter ubique]
MAIIKNKKYLIPVIFFIFFILNYIFYLIWINKFSYAQDFDGNLIIGNLTFFFGDLINNIIYKNEYYFKHGYDGANINFVLGRLPFIPLFLSVILKYISMNYLYVLLIKNILLFFIFFLTLIKTFKNNYILLIGFGILIYNPHNLFTTLSLIPEEGYLTYLLISLFLLMNKINSTKDIYFISVLLLIIYLTKASMAYMSYSLAIYLIFRLKNKFKLLYFLIPITFILIGYVSWAAFGYSKTNKIISPLSISTMSGSTLIVSSNKDFKKLYYLITPDPLEKKMWIRHKDGLYKNNNLKDEFEINEYFINKSKEYILNNKIEFIKLGFLKAHVVFTNLKKDAQVFRSEGYNTIRYSNISNKIILFISVFLIIKNIINKKFRDDDMLYLIILLSFMFPYFVGWVYTRHMVPLYLIAHFFLLLKFEKSILKKINF